MKQQIQESQTTSRTNTKRKKIRPIIFKLLRTETEKFLKIARYKRNMYTEEDKNYNELLIRNIQAIRE